MGHTCSELLKTYIEMQNRRKKIDLLFFCLPTVPKALAVLSNLFEGPLHYNISKNVLAP